MCVVVSGMGVDVSAMGVDVSKWVSTCRGCASSRPKLVDVSSPGVVDVSTTHFRHVYKCLICALKYEHTYDLFTFGNSRHWKTVRKNLDFYKLQKSKSTIRNKMIELFYVLSFSPYTIRNYYVYYVLSSHTPYVRRYVIGL